MKVLEHDHSLKLIDLQVKNEDTEESDEEEDLGIQDEFVCPCKRCDQSINENYRYYYKCVDDSCDYSLHKFCAEVPTMLKHTTHLQPLTLRKYPYAGSWTCFFCGIEHKTYDVGYTCDYYSYFYIDISCGVERDKKMIHHPSHPHPLVSPIVDPIFCYCSACGKKHNGIFFICNTCPTFSIHSDCAFLPKSLLIQQTTNGIFHHSHPLTLSYSFPTEEQNAKYSPTCRVCNGSFRRQAHIWIYKCEMCIYYAHVDCTISRRTEPFMSILSRGQTVKNFEDADYPNLFHLPFPDQTYSILRQLFLEESGPTTYGIDKVSLQHTNHDHELILVNTKCMDGASSSIHNPMKKIELLCNACVRPIMEMRVGPMKIRVATLLFISGVLIYQHK